MGMMNKGKIMSPNLITTVGRGWLKSLTRLATFALASYLVIALASPAQAQTFDQAVQNALRNAFSGGNCSPPLSPTPGSNLATICDGTINGLSGTVADAASGGSTTALARESSPIEERKIRGVMGPFSLFLSGEYESFDKDLTKFEPGHKTDTWRALFGVDYSFSDRFVLGVAFNYVNNNGNFDGGGRFDTDSYGGLVHASFVPAPNFFIDASAGYTRKNYFISRLASLIVDTGDPTLSFTTLGTTTGDTDGNEFKVGVNGGYNFNFKSVTFGPRLGLHYKHTKIDSFRERGNTGLELVYGSQTEKSLTGILGLYGSIAISTGFGVLVPQTTVEYVHEFQDDQRRINFRFVEDDARARFRFENDPPDRNYFNLGVGIVAVLPHGFSPFINYRALVGYNEQSSHAVTAGLRVEF